MPIEVRELTSEVPRLKVESISIEKGGTYILVGPNGSGKTTLLKALVGLLETQSLSHEVDGTSLKDLSLTQRSSLFGYCPQQLKAHADLNGETFLTNAMLGNGQPQSSRLSAAQKALRAACLSHLATRPLTKLSGGEWQRLILLSLELKNVPYWFLDEPTNHLDPANQIEILKLLAHESLTNQRTIVIASHELSLLGLLHQPANLPPPTLLLMKDGALEGVTDLSAPDLADSLSRLFNVEFRTERDELGRTFIHPGREVHDA